MPNKFLTVTHALWLGTIHNVFAKNYRNGWQQIWCELRHLSLAELAVVVSCVVSGSALPDFLLNPADGVDGGGAGGGGGSSCSGGKTGRARMLSRSSRGSAHFESGGGYDYASEYSRGMSRGEAKDE